MARGATSAGGTHETEVKIRVDNLRKLRARLKQLGYVPVHPRRLEDNVLFDTPERALRQVRSILRIRHYGAAWTLTYKGTPEPDRFFKSRVELETEVANPSALRAVFEMLGLVPVFRYQKYRSEYALPGKARPGRPRLKLALDETPIGDFMELEGSRRAIDQAARQLGYSRADYTTASYGALYLEECARRNQKPSDMVFPHAAKERARRRTANQ